MDFVEARRMLDRVTTLGHSAGQVYNPTLVLRSLKNGQEVAVIVANGPRGTKFVVVIDGDRFDDTWPAIFIHDNGYDRP